MKRLALSDVTKSKSSSGSFPSLVVMRVSCGCDHRGESDLYYAAIEADASQTTHLINVIFTRKVGLSLQKFRKYAARAPNINRLAVLVAGKHNLGCPIPFMKFTCEGQVQERNSKPNGLLPSSHNILGQQGAF